MRNKTDEIYYNALVIPGMVFIFIFSILPMFGIIIAFKNFVPAKGIFGSDWVGLKHFRRMFMTAEVRNVLYNTVYLAVIKMVLNLVVPVVFAILLNEIKNLIYKRVLQTFVYLPHFLSWVILGIMFSNIFGYNGMFNKFVGLFGVEPVMHMISNGSFRKILIFTDIWKNFGYGAIIYIAAITNIDPNLYEAAEIDGANRWHKMIYITFPSIKPTVVLMATLSLGSILNAGFEQVFAMYSPLVYETGDIIDTYVYRMGLTKAQYSFSTAVGLFKSVVSFFLIILSYALAGKFAGYTIF